MGAFGVFPRFSSVPRRLSSSPALVAARAAARSTPRRRRVLGGRRPARAGVRRREGPEVGSSRLSLTPLGGRPWRFGSKGTELWDVFLGPTKLDRSPADAAVAAGHWRSTRPGLCCASCTNFTTRLRRRRRDDDASPAARARRDRGGDGRRPRPGAAAAAAEEQGSTGSRSRRGVPRRLLPPSASACEQQCQRTTSRATSRPGGGRPRRRGVTGFIALRRTGAIRRDRQ